MTRFPRSRSDLHKWLPTKPAPPVTRTVLKKYPEINQEYIKIRKTNPDNVFFYQVIRGKSLKKYLLLEKIYSTCVKAVYTPQAIESIKESPFLQGQNKRGWIITFDWFIKPNNFIKVLEGNYIDNKKQQNSSNPFLELLQEELEKEARGEEN